MKIALVHDYLREYGGAERVLEALHELYPNAPLYTAFVDKSALGIHWKRFKNWDIHESWITNIPLYKKLYSPLRILAPQFFENFDFSEYDVVISSSNMYFAKAIITPSNVPHISYCHTPPRSLYGYTTMTNWKKNPIIKLGGEIINHINRQRDFLVSQRVDFFIANSHEVQKRIQKFYRRDSKVIYPPVDVEKSTKYLSQRLIGLRPKIQNTKYYLYVSRLALSKHPEIAVQTCKELDVPLKVVGTGRMLEKLTNINAKNVEFLGAVNDERLHKLYKRAEALVYPVEDEDFGIVPVEAMGHGIPVIAHNSGGPKETVIDGKTGVLFDELSVQGLKEAIKIFKTKKWNKKTIHKHALSFTKARFKKEIDVFVQKVVKN